MTPTNDEATVTIDVSIGELLISLLDQNGYKRNKKW